MSPQVVCTNLEHMKRLKLDILALISQQVHHHFQICVIGNIPGHHVEICAVEENLAEELKRLPLCDVVAGHDEGREGGEELCSFCY